MAKTHEISHTDRSRSGGSEHAAYGHYQSDIYMAGLHGEAPTLTTDPRKWQAAAQAKLSANAYGYVAGGAGAQETMDANRAAFRKWSIIPKMLRDNTKRDMEVEIFGEKFPCPVLMAPVGVNQIFHHDSESSVARAAARVGMPYIMSTASSTSIEDVAEASGGGKRWFQLYWPQAKDNDITVSMLSRARQHGFTTLVVTLDLWQLSWRPMDLDNAYVPFFLGIGDAVGFSDPVWQKKWKASSGKQDIGEDMLAASLDWENRVFSGAAHTWDELAFLKEHWHGPIVLKGIQSVEDAENAVQAGLNGIIVSNHGGRQYDGAVGSLDMLPEIVQAVGDKLTVLFDSGIRTGADIMKALALGAKAVLVGRPIIYGLSCAGEKGAEHVMRCLLADLDMNIGLTGLKGLSELKPSILRREEQIVPFAAGSW